MNERREPPRPRRHRALLHLAAGVAMSATLALPTLPVFAQVPPTATPRAERPTRDPEPTRAPGRRNRDDRAALGEPVAIVVPIGQSVRPRGAAAPVRLGPTSTPSDEVVRPERSPTATPEARRGADQAPLNQPLGSERRYAVPKKPEIDTGVRVWPMREGDYSFSQEYGCVEQISGFYPAADGCPASRPVVHSGLDFAADTGTLIYAAASGWVTEAGLDRETGLANTRLVIQHEGKNRDYATEYLHWIASLVKPGDYVRAGEPIAEVGSVGYSTGPHLHFAVIDFRTGEYLDPRGWLPGATDEGDYRETRRERARTRYADRSAGVPDYHDPAPAPAPTRQPVPEPGAASGQAGTGAGASREDRKRERRQRKAERRDRMRAAATAAAAAEPTQAPREDRVRRDRTADEATGVESGDPAARDRDRDRSKHRKPDDGGKNDARPRDEKGNDKDGGSERDKSRDRSTRAADAGNVAGVPDDPIIGGLPTESTPEPSPAPTATPGAGDEEPEARRGTAR